MDDTIRSNVSSMNGSAATSATVNVTREAPAAAAARRASATISGDRSTPSMRSPGTARARASGTRPGPVPASRTRAPSGSPAAATSAAIRVYMRPKNGLVIRWYARACPASPNIR